MIQSAPALLAVLTGTAASVQIFSKTPFGKKAFKYLPVPLWCYFLPTVFSTAGILPSENPLYGLMSRWLLPACLILLLVGTDLPAIFKLSRKALAAMLSGTLGIAMGGCLTFILGSRGALPADVLEDLWKGWGCLSGSWTGGSANMIAVKESLQAPESLFANLIIVDTVVAYSWMALLVFLSKYQDAMDVFLMGEKSGPRTERDAGASLPEPEKKSEDRPFWKNAALAIFVTAAAFLVAFLCASLGKKLPAAGAVLTPVTWTVLLATAVPLALSLTPVRQVEAWGAGRAGQFLLLLLLTSIGARASLATLFQSPAFVLLGLVWVAVHGLTLIALGRLFKIPSALLATASQANVGGPVSAPIVAEVYGSGLAPVGVILAVFGNIYGTAFGLFFSQICRGLKDFL